MARHAKTLSQGNSAAEHLSTGILALCFPMATVRSILVDCGRCAKRRRDLPPEVMVFFVIAMSLFPDVSYRGVLGWLLAGLQWLGNGGLSLCAKSSLAAARQRLGAEPMRRIHEVLAVPLDDRRLRGSHWKGRLLVALDGSTLALQDTPENRTHYGRPSNQKGEGAWPLARFAALAEVGTHLVFEAALGSYHDSEIVLARRIVGTLRPGMLCLADRLFPGYGLWGQAAATGADLLWRAKGKLALEHVRTLADGSWLARWHPSDAKGRKGRKGSAGEPHLVRVVEYRLQGREEVFRLVTTILDCGAADAKELAALYPERWEIEIAVKEGKTVLRRGTPTLRSRLPELVEQEFWGMILAHYAVRRMMAMAALESAADPDTLSYAGGVEIVKARIAGPSVPHSPPCEDTSGTGPGEGVEQPRQKPGA